MTDQTGLQVIRFIAVHHKFTKVKIFQTEYTRMEAINKVSLIAEVQPHIVWSLRREGTKLILY